MPSTRTCLASFLVAALCACRSGTPAVEAHAELVDFGAVELGSQAQRTLTLTNSGSGAAALRDLQVVGGDGQFTVEPSFSAIDLPESGALTVVLTFRPASAGLHLAELTLTAADERKSIALRGEAFDPTRLPRVSVLPRAIEFGEAVPGAEQRVFVSNVGDAPLRLGKWAGTEWQPAAPMLDGADASAFEIRLPAGTEQPTEIAAGATLELTVRLVAPALGEKHATLHLHTDDAQQPDLDVPVHAVVAPAPPCSWTVEPAALDLRSPDGAPVSASFAIRALDISAAEWCVIRNLRLSPDSAPEFALPQVSLPWAGVRRGDRFVVEVRFAPATSALFTGSVTFDVDGAVPSTGTVHLTGLSGPTSCLLTAPAELDFGDVARNCSSRERAISVYNVCGTAVTVDSIEITGPGSTEFRITAKPVLPRKLEAGEQLEFKANYRPTDVGEDTQTVAISVRAGVSGAVRFIGRSSTWATFQTDEFQQNPPAPKVDMLLVIDESPSMADKQQAIASNFGGLVDFWDRYCVDYQLAVTTTSVDSAHGGSGSAASIANGRFLPVDGSRPRIVTPSTPDHRQVALQNAAVGTNGSTPEYLALPAKLALSPPLSTSENAGFVRPDAQLLFVAVIADSADHDATPVADYAASFKALKTGPGQHAIVEAVVPTRTQPAAGCTYGEPDAGLSTRMTDLAALTGGSAYEVCQSNWFWGSIVGSACPRTRFYLSSPPADAQLIRVDIDGQAYPAVGPNREVRWTYNSTQNSIDFEAGFAPPPRALLKVAYSLQCPIW